MNPPHVGTYVKSVTQLWFGWGALKLRLSRSGARAESFPVVTVLRGLRPRTRPFMPSSRYNRSTVCLDTPANSPRLSQAVILRRP